MSSFQTLKRELQSIFPKESSDYFSHDYLKIKRGSAFFPGGFGLYNSSGTEPDLNDLDIMVLGQDFGKESDYINSQDREKGEESGATWQNIISFFKDDYKLDLKRCFFTNAVMGFRTNTNSISPSAIFKDEFRPYRAKCEKYLKFQIKIMRPNKIIVLGKPAAKLFLPITDQFYNMRVKTFKDLDKSFGVQRKVRIKGLDVAPDVIIAVHPCLRRSNAKNCRTIAAERQMFKRFLEA